MFSDVNNPSIQQQRAMRMTTAEIKRRKEQRITDLVDHRELLNLFRDYVDQCIEDYSFNNKPRPLSFDEWYHREFDRDSQTNIVTFELLWEGASGGYLTGSMGPETHKVRIPEDIVTGDNGGIVDQKRFVEMARKFANKMHRRLPTVLYKGKRAYHWTWD